MPWQGYLDAIPPEANKSTVTFQFSLSDVLSKMEMSSIKNPHNHLQLIKHVNRAFRLVSIDHEIQLNCDLFRLDLNSLAAKTISDALDKFCGTESVMNSGPAE